MAQQTYKFLPPRLADSIRNLELTVRRPLDGLNQGLHRSSHHGASVEFAEYRDYTPGDPINLVDWAVYARSDKHVIRQFHEEVNIRAYILLDISGSLAYQQKADLSKMDYCCFLAAGLMYILINQRDSAGLITFDSTIRENLPPVSSFTGLKPHLQTLEKIVPRGASNIESAIHQVAELVSSRSLMIIVSDFLENPEQVVKGIKHLYHDGHDIMMVHVLDGGEINLSFDAMTELRELETGKRLVINPGEIKEAYRLSVDHYLEQIRSGCTETSADYSLIESTRPLADALHELTRRSR